MATPKNPELAMSFLNERRIAWFCNSIELLTQCHDHSFKLAKNAKSIRDIARTVVTMHRRTLTRSQLEMYTRCVRIAGELARQPHLNAKVTTHDTLHEILPDMIADMTQIAKSLRQTTSA